MQRQSQQVRMEAPIGGWNTRDSIDNIPPNDALVMTNWIPDLGELRTRPGYAEHAWIGNLVSGGDLVTNGDFEALDPAPFNTFLNWTGFGVVTTSTDLVHGGTYSAGLTPSGVGPSQATIDQDIVVTASTSYRLQFWVYNNFQDAKGAYSIYDNTNAADIVAETFAGTSGGVWEKVSVLFTTPVGCISIKLKFYSPVAPVGRTALFDDVTLYASVDVGDVETLAVYEKGTTNILMAACAGKFYNVSTATPVDITKSGATHTVDRWQWANFDGKIGFVNGTDTPQQWAGTGLMTDLTITGPTATSVIGINVFKNRTWFWERDSQDVWYSALNTLGGSLTQFPLSRVGQFGGNMVAMVTWTRDGGSGPDDFAVFVMSSGEALVYQGSSPATGGDWALVGVYNIGEPLSVRSVVKFGGDVYIITRLDYVNLSAVLAGVEANTNKSKVVGALREALGSGGSLWGWEANIYPKGQLAIFNIPQTAGAEYIQHVMNTVTGAWCKFEGILSHTWQEYSSRMFFGGSDGYIYEFDVGNSDADLAIESEFQTAWLPIGGFVNKMFTAIREFFRVNAPINTVNQYAVDYQSFEVVEYPAAVTSASAEWGDPWGTPWSALEDVVKNWETVGIYGETISFKKRLSTKQKVRYLGASWLFRAGERL